jgi:MFS family permease
MKPAASTETMRATPWPALIGVTAALAVFGAAQGLSYPLFTIIMQKQGMSPAMIGLSASMMPLGLLLSAGLIPGAVRVVGARRLVVICALLGGLCFLAIGVLRNEFGWFAVRFLIGVVVNPLYVLGEVWALALAPPAQRGRVVGVFNTMMGLGYAVGPLTLAVVGTEGWAPFGIAIGAFVLSAAVLTVVAAGLPGFEAGEGGGDTGVLGFARAAPALLVAVLVSAAAQQSTYSLMPVFGAAYGLRDAALAALVTALSAGNVLLQIPLGLCAERVGGRAMIIFCATATGLCAIMLPVVILTPFAWPLLLVMGGVGYGVYTMATVELGSRFQGPSLVSGNAAFAVMWGLGGIVGPPGAGALMQVAGAIGLPLVLALLCGILVAFAGYRAATRRR